MAEKNNASITPMPDPPRENLQSKFAPVPCEPSFKRGVDRLPDDVAGRLLKSILEHTVSGCTTAPDGMDEFAFDMFISKVDEFLGYELERKHRYERRAKKAAAGRWGGEHTEDADENTQECLSMHKHTQECLSILARDNNNARDNNIQDNNIYNNIQDNIINNNNINNNNLPTYPPTPLNPPFPRPDAEKGDGPVGGSVGSSFSSENKKTFARKPSSYSELEDYVTGIGYSTFDTEALWHEMEESDWQIPDKKSGKPRPLKSWRNFVKYRAENSTEPDETISTRDPDKPILKTPEDKKIYERYVKEGIHCSFEAFRNWVMNGNARKFR